MSACLCQQPVILSDAVNNWYNTFLYDVLIILLIVANFHWYSKKFHGDEESLNIIISMRAAEA